MNTPYCPAPRRERRVLRIVRETLGELPSAGLFVAALVLIGVTFAMVLDAPGGLYMESF